MTFRTAKKRKKQKLHIAPGLVYIKIHKKKYTFVADTCTCIFVERSIYKEKKQSKLVPIIRYLLSKDRLREEKVSEFILENWYSALSKKRKK